MGLDSAGHFLWAGFAPGTEELPAQRRAPPLSRQKKGGTARLRPFPLLGKPSPLALGQSRIEDVPQSVAKQVEGEDAETDSKAREHCDQLVHIPMKGRVESLNVSVAASVLLYEVVRQRLSA